MIRVLLMTVTAAIAGCVTPSTTLDRPPFVSGRYAEGVPDISDALTESMRPYREVRGAVGLGFVDDALLISTRFGETSQLHQVAAPMGMRRQLTFARDPVAAAVVPPVPAPTHFVFARDEGGAEFYQLYSYSLATGESQRLTDGVSRHEAPVWSTSGTELAYTRARRDGSRDVIVHPLGGTPEVLFNSSEGAWAVLDFSPDDEHLLLLQYFSIGESYLYEYDRMTANLEPLLDETLRASVREAAYDHTGGILFLADLGAEFVRLHRLDRARGTIEVLTGDLSWDVENFVIAPDGSYLVMVVNEEGFSRVMAMALPSRRFVALPELPAGVVLGMQFDATSRSVAVTLSSATSTADVYVLSLDGRTLTQWTQSEVGGLLTSDFTAPELIRYPTFDEIDGARRQIPAFLYRPKGAGPHPVAVLIHGGPEAQFRPYFSSTIAYLVGELGVAVIAPNVRGSAGYGKSYLKLDDGRSREDSVRDIGALLDWIAQTPGLDASRVALMGGSYGGYMVLASLVHFGDRIAAAAESFGISHFVTFLENTEPYRQDLRRAEYGDERDPEMRTFLDAISPLTHADTIRTPLFVAQGFNDPRVPASESAQIVEAVREHAPVWYVIYEQEGHGFGRKSNADHYSAVATLFLKTYLLAQ